MARQAGFKRWTVGTALRWAGLPSRNRRRFWRGLRGLRILGLHVLEGRELDRFRAFVDWCRDRFDLASPSDVDALVEGRLEPRGRDRLLFTFDDGHEPDFRVAEWLHGEGIEAVFFVIPSYVDRSARQFVNYHRSRGVEAYDIGQHGDRDSIRGLSRAQLVEMKDMGHRIGGHNFAHRNLALLETPPDLEYEIAQALDTLGEWLGDPCQDFAWAFGRTKHLSMAAAEFLSSRCPRVYSSVRGLNCPAVSPRILLRDTIDPGEPFAFSRLCALGGADHLYQDERARLAQLAGGLP